MYDSLGEKFDVFVLFNDTATTEIYTYLHTLSLHDARPICCKKLTAEDAEERRDTAPLCGLRVPCGDSSGSCFDRLDKDFCTNRSEEHTSELQSLMRISYAVFCLKKKTTYIYTLVYSPTESHSKPNDHTTTLIS